MVCLEKGVRMSNCCARVGRGSSTSSSVLTVKPSCTSRWNESTARFSCKPVVNAAISIIWMPIGPRFNNLSPPRVFASSRCNKAPASSKTRISTIHSARLSGIPTLAANRNPLSSNRNSRSRNLPKNPPPAPKQPAVGKAGHKL